MSYDLSNLDTMSVSNVLRDSFVHFVYCYANYSDLIISCAFSRIGVYQMTNKHSRHQKNKVKLFRRQFDDIHYCSIWNELHELSTLLRYSYLYNVTYSNIANISKVDDEHLTKSLKAFKYDMVNLMTNHAAFLAYCELEHAHIFMFTNGTQAITKDVFIQQYNAVASELFAILTKYKNKIPKVFYTIIYDLQHIIDVREIYEETLIVPVQVTELPKIAISSLEQTRKTANGLVNCDLNMLRTCLTSLYSQSVPLFVLSHLKWIIYMQGERLDGMTALSSYIPADLLQNLKTYQKSFDNSAMCLIKKELQYLPYLSHVFTLLEDKDFFESYSTHLLGEFAISLIRELIRLYLKNIDILVLSDLIDVGVYDLYNQSSKLIDLNLSELDSMIHQAQKSIVKMENTHTNHPRLQKLCRDSTYHLKSSLKRVQRYNYWLSCMQDDACRCIDGIDLIFGTVLDSDGAFVTCSICLEDSTESCKPWFKLECGHRMHTCCIDSMLEAQNTCCPLCRSKMEILK